ncbi:hypothetical protein PCJ53_29130, partial [Klebsiella pneumoniae]|nr:hypothetical protein [Klebsiella pneumoniae]
MDEHECIDLPLCDEVCGYHRLAERRCRGQHPIIMRIERVDRLLLGFFEITLERQTVRERSPCHSLVVDPDSASMSSDKRDQFIEASSRQPD